MPILKFTFFQTIYLVQDADYKIYFFRKFIRNQDADQQLELLPICLCLQRPEVLAQRKPTGANWQIFSDAHLFRVKRF